MRPPPGRCTAGLRQVWKFSLLTPGSPDARPRGKSGFFVLTRPATALCVRREAEGGQGCASSPVPIEVIVHPLGGVALPPAGGSGAGVWRCACPRGDRLAAGGEQRAVGPARGPLSGVGWAPGLCPARAGTATRWRCKNWRREAASTGSSKLSFPPTFFQTEQNRAISCSFAPPALRPVPAGGQRYSSPSAHGPAPISTSFSVSGGALGFRVACKRKDTKAWGLREREQSA